MWRESATKMKGPQASALGFLPITREAFFPRTPQLEKEASRSHVPQPRSLSMKRTQRAVLTLGTPFS